MSLAFHWFLPTYGDSRNLVAGGHGTAMQGDRAASLRYLHQICGAAEDNGFEAVLTPTGLWCEDAWLTTAMLIEGTETLKFLVAFRPGLLSPTLAAQMAGTFQRHSRGRLLLNVVTGGEPHEQQAYGDYLDKQSRYARTAEFLHVVRELWTSREPVTFTGDHIRVEGAALNNPPDPVPAVFFGGSSGPAGPVAAKYSDVYLTWGEPPAAVGEKLDWIRGLAAENGRQLQFGLRIHVISRDTSEQAWAEADRLLAAVDPADVERVQSSLARSESEGQRRMLRLHGGNSDTLLIAPNLWAGVGLVRGGAGTALVGSHAEVADRLAEYAALGIDHFILSGYPHLEEAYWFGEGVLPLLERKGLWTHPNRTSQPAASTPFAVSSAH
jgi:alkanesulfonate monooxygenase